MIRDFLNSAMQKKFFLMFFTSLIYIIGLIAYFSNLAVFTAFILMIISIFAVLKNYVSPKLVLLWYFMFFFAFFNASLRIKNTDTLYQLAPQDAAVQGQIVSIPANNFSDKTRFFFEVSKIKYNGKEQNLKAKTLMNIYSGDMTKLNFNIGDNYEIKGKLRTPFKVSNPSQFDYGKYLRDFGTFTVFYADKNDCKMLENNLSLKWNFLQGLNNIRNEIIKTNSQYLKSPNLELLGGIVFGDDAVSPPDSLKNSFTNSGLLHLLAASGMNVALIYGIWFFILRRLKVPFNITVISGIFIIIFYTLMTGLGPSVIRAAFMLIFILLGKLIDRDAHNISLLFFIALLMLIYNPAYINGISFQLSFTVTFGLLVTMPVVLEKLKISIDSQEKEKSFIKSKIVYLLQWLSGAIAVPVIAQLWVAPIQMYYFNSFNLYSVFANVAVLPFVTVISFGGFISSVLALIKPLANHVCLVFDFLLTPFLNMAIFISDYFSSLPNSLIQMPQPSILQIILYYLSILLLILLFKTGLNKKIILSTAFVFICLIFSCLNLNFSPSLETIVFDVQNADAFLIKTPNNRYFLIDSGKTGYNGGKTQAKCIILEYLKDKGIKNIEGLIITHFDSDHAGGAVDFIKNLNIKKVYVNSLNDKSRIAREIYKQAEEKIKLAKNNEIIYKEDHSGKSLIIKNFIPGFDGDEYENENSIITLVSYDDFDELFMGDAGVLGFERIKNHLPGKIEILKVGHHGAKNVINKAFLDRINPQTAIISTGVNNYGHPNAATLNILENNNVKILRTDRKNAIKIKKELNEQVSNKANAEVNHKYKIYTYDKTSGWVSNF